LAAESPKWRDVEHLQKVGITHVINLRRNIHNRKVRQFKSLWLPSRDDKKPRPRWFYRKAVKFYQRAIGRKENDKNIRNVQAENLQKCIADVFPSTRLEEEPEGSSQSSD
jgi:hypothetical protein